MSDVAKQLALLAVRKAVDDLEWITACLKNDVSKYGEAQCDWFTARRDSEQRLDDLIKRAEKFFGS